MDLAEDTFEIEIYRYHRPCPGHLELSAACGTNADHRFDGGASPRARLQPTIPIGGHQRSSCPGGSHSSEGGAIAEPERAESVHLHPGKRNAVRRLRCQ